MKTTLKLAAFSAFFLLFPAICFSDNLIDHRVNQDKSGIYRLQDAVPVGLGLFTLGCALWEGSETRIGRSCWESGEAAVGTAVVTTVVGLITRRQSPEMTDSANHFFEASGTGSFPSDHVAVTTALVTPLILEYREEYPWVYSLALLPAYEMVARVKARAHWQTDVVAGALIGYAIGSYEFGRDSPFVFALMPGGAFAGLKTSF